MFKLQIPFNRNKKYLLGVLVLIFLASASLAFSLNTTPGFDLARREILMRTIGHHVLLFAGDSTSRVLPIKNIDNHTYQIKFEKQLTFQTDSLMKIVKTVLAEDKTIDDYILNVLDCSKQDVMFGYAVLESENKNIIPCSRRVQPKDCYIIELQIKNTATIAIKGDYILGGLPILALVGFLCIRVRKKDNEAEPDEHLHFMLGNTTFDAEKKTLLFAGAAIDLTVKECKLLLIFAKLPNVVIERASLQKEIWEDEGVIVGRSLDMFISKLRKKLEADPSVQLKNIHGKGYKLEI